MNKNISLKNYIILSIVILLTVFITLYFYFWYRSYRENKNYNSTMFDSALIIRYNELDNYLTENKEAVIYFSGSYSDSNTSFEKKLNKYLSSKSINIPFLYLNVSNELGNKKTYKQLKDSYGVNTPYIIVFKDSELSFKFDIRRNNYDINKLDTFLKNEGIIND